MSQGHARRDRNACPRLRIFAPQRAQPGAIHFDFRSALVVFEVGDHRNPEFDIARAAVWLASDDSDYLIGATLFVDGGMTLFPGFATGG